jgi:hypothetical protein
MFLYYNFGRHIRFSLCDPQEDVIYFENTQLIFSFCFCLFVYKLRDALDVE